MEFCSAAVKNRSESRFNKSRKYYIVAFMRELIVIWKNLFTNPPRAFSRITGQENGWIMFLLVLAVSVAAFIPVIPIVSNVAYSQAQSRATIRTMQEIGMEMTQELQDELSSQEPLMRIIFSSNHFLNQISEIGLKILSSALVLMVTGFFFRERRSYRLYISLFSVLAVFLILEAAVKNTIVLSSDIIPSLNTAQTMEDITNLFTPRTSLAVILPADTGVFTAFTIDYFTDIFRLVQLGFLTIAISVVWKRDMRTALSATIVFAMVDYLPRVFLIMNLLGK